MARSPKSTITKKVYERLKDDSEIQDIVSSFNGEPSVFTKIPVPGDVDKPYLTIPQTSTANTDNEFSSKQDRAIQFSRSVRGYDEEVNSEQTAENLLWRCFELLHDNKIKLNLSDWEIKRMIATGPFNTPTEQEDLIGFGLSLTLFLVEV